jgi:GNAT superfamily N-acetyltransferase
MPASLRSENCSPSARNAVRVPVGISVRLRRNPHQVLPEWGDNMAEDVLLSGEGAFAVIGYAGAEPVATAITYVLEGILFVAFVATLPGHQRKGYAEAVMRRSLEAASRATGLSRTVLHATPAGQSVYERMGYHSTTPFTMYLRPPQGAH